MTMVSRVASRRLEFQVLEGHPQGLGSGVCQAGHVRGVSFSLPFLATRGEKGRVHGGNLLGVFGYEALDTTRQGRLDGWMPGS